MNRYPREVILTAALSEATHSYNYRLVSYLGECVSFEELFGAFKTDPTVLPENIRGILASCWGDKNLEIVHSRLEKNGIQACLITDDTYPVALRAIDDPPYVLYFHGDLSILNTYTCVACVGTRAISVYGRRAIGSLLRPLQGVPLCIVSGLALGIDAEVHRQALANNNATVAVLGGGLDRYEPLTNSTLGAQIAQSGCVISEYPPGVRPQKHHFLERNRIIAGLSRATIIIEGKEHSGSLVTARLALKYGREVGVVPGDIFALNSQGPLRLLKDGAWPICESEDILTMCGVSLPSVKTEAETPLVAILRSSPQSLDALCRMLHCSLTSLQEDLTLLELEGRVAVTATGEYYIK